ncbi:MAG TPA: InlB B-repeat-containing protein [Candidatus Cryosericum sp.]|nr:InlB B-repeat-containing protein [Candidatus Cryosericum sp.]
MRRWLRLFLVSILIAAVTSGSGLGLAQAHTPAERDAAFSVAAVQAGGANPDLVRSFVDDSGRQVDELVISGRPPAVKAQVASDPEPRVDGSRNALTNVPAFDWSYGCSATAAAMLFGYYDNTGYPNMYTGSTNGGLCPMTNAAWGSGECPISASHEGIDGRATRGHVDDYWVEYYSTAQDPYIGHWSEHAPLDCAADFMGTNQSKYGNSDGSTTFYFNSSGLPLSDYVAPDGKMDGCHGMRLSAESHGYTVTANFSQYIDAGPLGKAGGFTFNQFKAEIDAGRPLIVHVKNHSMLGYGYDSTNQTIYVHDTWDYSSHTMIWGGTYSGDNLQQYAVTVIRLAPAGPSHTLKTSVSPVAGGTIVESPSLSSYPSGTVVTLTAVAATGYAFSSWSGDVGGSVNPVTITMDADKTVTATFATVPTYTLTVAPSEHGTVTRSPDQTAYNAGSVVTVRAAAAQGYAFGGWSGDLSGSANPTTITMTKDKNIAATFTALPSYTLTTTVSPGSGGTVSRSPAGSSYLSGTTVTLTASAAAGYTFTGWSGDLTGSANPATLVMNGDKAVTAVFAADTSMFALTVNITGSGTVARSPDQSSYLSGTSVTLVATPANGYVFSGWTGDLTGATNPATITMTRNKVVGAVFSAIPAYLLTLTVSPLGGGSITSDPDQTSYFSGTVVTLTAIPAVGYAFSHWSGNLSGTSNPATITMTGNRAVGAVFTALPTYALTVTSSPLAGGSVEKNPDQSSYFSGAIVTLLAVPASGYVFTGWSGGLTGHTNPSTITMNANKSVTAMFAVAPARTLKVGVVGSGYVTKSPNLSSYLSGTSVTLTAVPLPGYAFTGWSGDLTGLTNPTTIVMDVDKSITATFAAVHTYALTVTSSGRGTVVRSPDLPSYSPGSTVTLTASAAAGYAFSGWSGDLTGLTNPTTIVMDGDKTVAATFEVVPPGSVSVVATLDGEPWSGAVQFSLNGDSSSITGSSVPFRRDGVAVGSLSIDVTGGPGGKVLRYVPSRIQEVASNAVTTFTLQYWSEASMPGDVTITAPLPGDVVGDSIDVEGTAYGTPPSGSLLTVTARTLPSGTPVLVVDSMQVDPVVQMWSGTLAASALGLTEPCDVEVLASLSGFPLGTETRITIHWAPESARVLSLKAGWNLVGVSSLAPLAAVPGFLQCFGYRNGWSVLGTADAMQPGFGYWVQVADDVDVVLPGLEASSPVSLDYEAGWQLLGNPFDIPLPVTSITNHTFIMTCYSYDAGWGIVNPATDSLQPGKGYWVNLSAATTLTLMHP